MPKSKATSYLSPWSCHKQRREKNPYFMTCSATLLTKCVRDVCDPFCGGGWGTTPLKFGKHFPLRFYGVVPKPPPQKGSPTSPDCFEGWSANPPHRSLQRGVSNKKFRGIRNTFNGVCPQNVMQEAVSTDPPSPPTRLQPSPRCVSTLLKRVGDVPDRPILARMHGSGTSPTHPGHPPQNGSGTSLTRSGRPPPILDPPPPILHPPQNRSGTSPTHSGHPPHLPKTGRGRPRPVLAVAHRFLTNPKTGRGRPRPILAVTLRLSTLPKMGRGRPRPILAVPTDGMSLARFGDVPDPFWSSPTDS